MPANNIIDLCPDAPSYSCVKIYSVNGLSVRAVTFTHVAEIVWRGLLPDGDYVVTSDDNTFGWGCLHVRDSATRCFWSSAK